MGGLTSRNKGKRGEREVVNILAETVWSVFMQEEYETLRLLQNGIHFDENEASARLATYLGDKEPLTQGWDTGIKRNTLQSDGGGFDLCGGILDGFPGLEHEFPPLAVEVKRQEKENVMAWWRQATVQAQDAGRYPVLFYRASRQPWRVMTHVTYKVAWTEKLWSDKVVHTFSLEEWNQLFWWYVYRMKLAVHTRLGHYTE